MLRSRTVRARRRAALLKAKFKVLRKELLCMAPEEYRDWLDKKLYNEPSLYERLIALASEPPEEVVRALVPNVPAWARATTDAGNDLAHRGESKRVNKQEMVAAVEVAGAVVIVNLLDQLRIPPARILRAVEHNPDLKMAASLARKHWSPS